MVENTGESESETESDKEIKTPEGKTTVDEKVSIECKIITYAAMFKIAAKIGEEISEKINSDRVVICDSNDMDDLYVYKTFKTQIKMLIEQYEIGIPEVAPPERVEIAAVPTSIPSITSILGLDTVTALLGSITDIISFFKTDTEIKGVEVGIETDSLIAEVAKVLKSKKITAIYPAFKTTESSEFLEDLSKLKEIADKKVEENPSDERIQYLRDQCSNLLKTLTITDEKTGINTLKKVLDGEVLNSVINNKDIDNEDITTYMLYLKAVATGGNNNIKTNILWNELSHSGGAIITYFLINKDGDLKASNNYYNLLGPYKFKKSTSNMPKNNFNQ